MSRREFGYPRRDAGCLSHRALPAAPPDIEKRHYYSPMTDVKACYDKQHILLPDGKYYLFMATLCLT